MSARKNRIYIVNLGDEAHLVRATTQGQAVQAACKENIRVRVAEPDDLIRLANQSGAAMRVIVPPEPRPLVDTGAPRGPGRPPQSAYAQSAPTSAEPASSEAA
jgi:hypothetical protein